MAEDVPLSCLPPLIPFLPDDVSVRCITLVPAASHTALSHVSRSWRSFVCSPLFSSLRSELTVTELVLTVSIRSLISDRYRWYHLHPHQPPSPLPPPQDEEQYKGAACASLGPRLFLLGGISSPNSVQIYDARLRRWAHGPPMSTPRKFANAGVSGGRIHVLGGCINQPPSPLAESLPTGTRWNPVPPIPAHLHGDKMRRSAVMDGKLIVVSEGMRANLYGAAFDADTAEWAKSSPWWREHIPRHTQAVVGGVPYAFNDERIFGYDDDWMPVEGNLEKELLCRVCDVTLLNFGGLLCLIGEEKETIDGFIIISWAGIDISRTDNGGFTGSILWLHSLKLSVEETLHHCVVLEM